MNRAEEYEQLIQELEENAPSLDGSLEKARRRKNRKNLILRPLGSMAAAFAIFVLLVNYCAPVAYACSKVPVLRELAEAVTFSRSLSDAVENEFVQEVNQSQTKGDITCEVAYLIVDQKQVNIFYRLKSDTYHYLYADMDVQAGDGSSAGGYASYSSRVAGESGTLLHEAIDFVDADVPDSLRLIFRVRDQGSLYVEEPAPEHSINDEPVETEPQYLEEFEFLLEFDPTFTAAGKIIEVDREVVLDGQTILVDRVEIYPTHLRLEVRDDPNNTAWLHDLEFTIQAEDGMVFSSEISGITATGSPEEGNKSMISYRAESSYFYDAEHLTLVITGAQWLDKSREKLYLNLTTGESDPMPEGVEFGSAERTENGWTVKLYCTREENEPMYQAFSFEFFDAEGNKYDINRWSTHQRLEEGFDETDFEQEFPLRNYTCDEVWLSPVYTHKWTAEEPVVIEVQ